MSPCNPESAVLLARRLMLRPFEANDLHDLYALNSDAETMRFISPPLSRDEVAGVIDWFAAEWDRLGYGWFAVFKRNTNEFVGQCGLQCLEGNAEATDVELAFVIDRSYWGQGYATEAAEAVIQFAWAHTDVSHVVAVTVPENVASQCVLRKLGFEHAGLREHYDRQVLWFRLPKPAA